VNVDIMEKHGGELADKWREDLDCFYDSVRKIQGIKVLDRDFVRAGSKSGADFDETKIVADFSGIGMSGEEAEKALIGMGIYPEFHTESAVMFLTGIGNIREDYELLVKALSVLAERN